MGKLILLGKYQDMKQKKRESTEDIVALLSHMTSEISKILDKPGIEMMEEREMQERKRFEERYKDVLLRAPASAEIQIQYFAGIMLEFLPDIFRDQAGRSDAYWGFIEFYISEFSIAYSNFHTDNKHSLEKEYPFRCTHLTADELKAGLQDCLIRLKNPKKNGRKQEDEIIRQSCRLFELEHCLSDWFDKVSGN